MRIFNLQLICKDETPVKGVYEFNTYSLSEASDEEVGKVYGVKFFATLYLQGFNNPTQTFYFIQCIDQQKIYLVPDNAESKEDYILIFSHSSYEELHDTTAEYMNFFRAEEIKNIWLYNVDSATKYVTNRCLGVN